MHSKSQQDLSSHNEAPSSTQSTTARKCLCASVPAMPLQCKTAFKEESCRSTVGREMRSGQSSERKAGRRCMLAFRLRCSAQVFTHAHVLYVVCSMSYAVRCPSVLSAVSLAIPGAHSHTCPRYGLGVPLLGVLL